MRRSSRIIGAILVLAGTVLAAGEDAAPAGVPAASSAAGPALHVTPQGRITQLAIDPRHTATVYAGTDAAGVYRSDNGGATWTRARTGLPDGASIAALLVDGRGMLFAATPKGVYKSTNHGAGWSSEGPPTGSPSTSLALDPTSANTIYAGTQDDGIFRSTNDGATWSAVGPRVTAVSVVATDPISGTTLYAGTDDGLLISTGHGLWQRAGLGHVAVQALGISAANPDTLYAGTADGVLLSRDGGASWARAGLRSRSISTLYVDPANSARAYAASASSGGLFLTTNAGHSWLPLVAGLSSDRVSALAIDPSDPSVAYAGLDQGVFKSLQGGRSWASSSIYDRSVRALLQPATATGTFYAGTNGGVYASTDGGSVWTSAGLGNHRVAALLPAAGSLLAATESGIYRTPDGGHTWLRALRTATQALIADPATAGTLFAGTVAGIFRSQDNGLHWTQLAAGTSAIDALLFRDDGALLAGGEPGMLISTDHGASFKRDAVNDDTVVQVLAHPLTAGTTSLFARTLSGHIYRSADGGVHWIDCSVGGAAATALTLSRDGLLYAAADRGIYRSSSNGASWILTNQQEQTLRPLVLQPAMGANAAALLEGLDGQGVLVRALRITPTSPLAPITSAVGRYFPETGHFVRAPFLDWYNSHNGAAIFGAPRTEQMREGGRLVQYFQNALLIYQPAFADTAQVIAPAPLGQQLLAAPAARIPSFDNTTKRRFFPQTGHSLSGEFLSYWRQYGGVDVFGYPISEPVTMNGLVVQYFQNARFEVSPSAGSQFFNTRLSPLGDALLKQKGWLS
jgi:photosystem II stability/assembly factor-like uncharacterized protein